MSDTVRADEHCALIGDQEMCHASFARQLERELAEAQDAAARWYTAAVPYATPSALYDALRAAQSATPASGWRDLAHEAFLQLEYLHERERKHSSTEAVLLRLSEKLGFTLDRRDRG